MKFVRIIVNVIVGFINLILGYFVVTGLYGYFIAYTYQQLQFGSLYSLQWIQYIFWQEYFSGKKVNTSKNDLFKIRFFSEERNHQLKLCIDLKNQYGYIQYWVQVSFFIFYQLIFRFFRDTFFIGYMEFQPLYISLCPFFHISHQIKRSERQPKEALLKSQALNFHSRIHSLLSLKKKMNDRHNLYVLTMG